MIIPANPGITVARKRTYKELEENLIVIAWEINSDAGLATALCVDTEGRLFRVAERDQTNEYARFEFPRGRVA